MNYRHRMLQLIALTVLLLAGNSLAQTIHQTGSVEGTIGGNSYHAYTYATEVPEDAAEGLEDGAVKDMVAAAAGTTQHSATFNLMDAVMMGTVELLPPTIFVTILTRTENAEDREHGRIDIDFSLDPETLTLKGADDIAVDWHPGEPDLKERYTLTDGSLVLDSITVVDENTLAITGSISGQLSWQTDYSPEHNPDDVLDVDLTFSIEQVVQSGSALDLIMGM